MDEDSHEFAAKWLNMVSKVDWLILYSAIPSLYLKRREIINTGQVWQEGTQTNKEGTTNSPVPFEVSKDICK